MMSKRGPLYVTGFGYRQEIKAAAISLGTTIVPPRSTVLVKSAPVTARFHHPEMQTVVLGGQQVSCHLENSRKVFEVGELVEVEISNPNLENVVVLVGFWGSVE